MSERTQMRLAECIIVLLSIAGFVFPLVFKK